MMSCLLDRKMSLTIIMVWASLLSFAADLALVEFARVPPDYVRGAVRSVRRGGCAPACSLLEDRAARPVRVSGSGREAAIWRGLRESAVVSGCWRPRGGRGSSWLDHMVDDGRGACVQ